MTRIEQVIQLLRDLTTTRLSGDTFQRGLVEMEIDRLDAEGGYERGQWRNENRGYYLSRRRRQEL